MPVAINPVLSLITFLSGNTLLGHISLFQIKTTHYINRTKNPKWEVSKEVVVGDFTKVKHAAKWSMLHILPFVKLHQLWPCLPGVRSDQQTFCFLFATANGPLAEQRLFCCFVFKTTFSLRLCFLAEYLVLKCKYHQYTVQTGLTNVLDTSK